MSDLLERAVAAIRQLPLATRDSFAQAILSLAEGPLHDEIEPEHLPFVLEGLAQIARGEFATEEGGGGGLPQFRSVKLQLSLRLFQLREVFQRLTA